MAEQRDVEMWFQDNGYLLPNFHKFYWMGLMTGEGFTCGGRNARPAC